MPRAAVSPPGIVIIRADGQIGHAVPVQVTQRGDGNAEKVAVCQRRSAAAAAGDLRADFDRARGRVSVDGLGADIDGLNRSIFQAPGELQSVF